MFPARQCPWLHWYGSPKTMCPTRSLSCSPKIVCEAACEWQALLALTQLGVPWTLPNHPQTNHPFWVCLVEWSEIATGLLLLYSTKFSSRCLKMCVFFAWCSFEGWFLSFSCTRSILGHANPSPRLRAKPASFMRLWCSLRTSGKTTARLQTDHGRRQFSPEFWGGHIDRDATIWEGLQPWRSVVIDRSVPSASTCRNGQGVPWGHQS